MGLKTSDGKTQHDIDEDDYYRSIGVDPDTLNADLPAVDPNDIVSDTEDNDSQEFDKITDHPWYWVYTQVKYILMVVFIAAPWTILGGCAVAWNIWLNIYFNQGWAGANIWLILNSVYLIFQYVLSLLLFYEIDAWIYYMKFIRFGSLISSYFYTIMYIVALVELLVIIDDLDGSEVTFVNMYTVMVLAYNLILHAPIIPVNIAIAAKEGSMEFVQFLNDWAGTGLDDWSLGLHNIVDFFIAIGNWLNPWWWFSDKKDWDEMYE